MPRRPTAPHKRRTREHVIADLSINFVERQVLLSGNTVERKLHDYGVDLVLSTYGSDGDPEPGGIDLQVKATDHLTTIKGGFVTCRIERAHLRAWLADPAPVFLILYDAANDQAYWLHIQAAFGGVRRFQAVSGSERLTVRFPAAQMLDPDAVRSFRSIHGAAIDLFRGVINADD